MLGLCVLGDLASRCLSFLFSQCGTPGRGEGTALPRLCVDPIQRAGEAHLLTKLHS